LSGSKRNQVFKLIMISCIAYRITEVRKLAITIIEPPHGRIARMITPGTPNWSR